MCKNKSYPTEKEIKRCRVANKAMADQLREKDLKFTVKFTSDNMETIVKITQYGNLNQMLADGFAFCNPKDTPCKSVGIFYALSRAMNALKHKRHNFISCVVNRFGFAKAQYWG